ncbi:hypothetical protein LTR36_000404 [Oleoguttula mirabilis]|uniref:Uncharacterized protein n=1 Tax=Oleoguttula mirabilis TaxID=1507867 RepID=A0AAV9JYU0_9PEZI|nr:hypothetical protein LTR36_000404 [Oleoguttula mirabilis]
MRQYILLELLALSTIILTDAQELQHVLADSTDRFPRLNFSSPSPLIFHSTFGLLQQWTNTFFPNGHTIAPCTIAKNTNLYHARGDGSFPPSPEWFGLDAEMSYFIAGAMPDSHLLTYRTTKNVKCVYFDGTSASLMDDGSMDAQMLLLHNNSANVPDRPAFSPPPRNDTNGRHLCGHGYADDNCTHWNPLQAEYDRASGLCDFIKEKNLGGPGWGFEGVVRMNAAFELIWCNFSSPSAKLVSWLNVSAPLLDGVESERRPWELKLFSGAAEDLTEPGPPTGPPREGAPSGGGGTRWPGRDHPFQSYSIYEWFHAAAKRYGFMGSFPGRGEARVRIDSCGLFTFHEPALKHQVHARIEQERKLYNLTAPGYWTSPEDENDRQAALTKLMRRRRMQRATAVGATDGLYMRAEVEDRMRTALEVAAEACSGIDWLLTTEEIVASFGGDLYDMSTTLSANVSLLEGQELRSRVARVREVLHGRWIPFYEYPRYTADSLNTAFALFAPESQQALARCKTQYAPFDLSGLPASEQTTYAAVAEVLGAICGTLLPVFLSLEQLWLANFNNVSTPPPEATSPLYADAQLVLSRNKRAIEELMAWLGWADQWTSCTPGCVIGQVCYIPIWPTGGMQMGRGGPPGNGTRYGYPPRQPGGMDHTQEYLWEPRCVDAEHYPPE